ncbi:hypothetical protein ERO13_A05G278500v2 [Gossypium hirsutum]|uniref:DUF7804 domain-containing protein n=1 Tax=Gossypium mustelinum TaxID=34275 RepID=A0A5D2ZE83_GOSMU|nr:hypothetical protein ERO13_A05G278500v2 [Gossypium hirsutum]TYJ36300.1 hypothetical protein E1A91_A05G298300v1 [Gossypium mustelinum]
MAVADGVCRGGNVCLRRRDSFNLFNFHNQNARPRCFMVSGSQSSSGSRKEKMLASSKEKIDEWMRDSVAEIVKRLPESPLLVEVFSDVKNNTTRTRTEKAEEDKWGLVKQKWEKGESPMPDGLIFVEQIQQGEEEEEGKEEVCNTRAWGIVVQGIGAAAPACYLLKTSKVGSGFGIRCTHFCLVRVKSFRETAFSQLQNCWLLQQAILEDNET